MAEELREKLAEYAHDTWSRWMNYMFRCGAHDPNGNFVVPQLLAERWTRQMNTAYEDLPKREKESDREEADRILTIVKRERGNDD